jgi:hypothetical protein
MTSPGPGDQPLPLWAARELVRDLRERFDDLELDDELADHADTVDDLLHDAADLIDDQQVHVALLGDTNAGKSTLVNAIIGHRLLPSSNSGPGTAVVTSLRYRPGPTITVDIRFATRADLRRAAQQLLDQLSIGGGDDTLELDLDLADLIDASRRRLGRIFGDSLDEYLASGHVSHLREVPEAAALLDEGHRTLEMDDPDAVHRALLQSADAAAAMGYLVERVDITGDFAPLATGVTLVDLPGLNDPDARRTDATRRFVSDADIVWVVFPLDTGLGKTTIRAAQSMLPLHRLLLDQRANGIRFVCTKTEEVGEEQARRLGIDATASEAERIRARDAAARLDIAAKIELLARPLERRLADQADDALTHLRGAPVHLVSAFEALDAASTVDGARLHRSGVPELRDELVTIGAALIPADALDSIGSQLEQVDRAVAALAAGTHLDLDAPAHHDDDAPEGNIPAWFRENGDAAVERFAAALRAKAAQFIGSITASSTAAFIELSPLEASWAAHNPRMLHATMMRRGVLTTQGGVHIDLNAELAQSFFLAVQQPWLQFFRYDARVCVQDVHQALVDLLAEANTRSGLDSVDRPYALLREAQGLARDVEVDTQQAVIETVRELLVPDYDTLAFSADATARQHLVGGLLDAVRAKRDALVQAVVLRTRLWVDAVVEDLVAAAQDDVAQHTARLARA